MAGASSKDLLNGFSVFLYKSVFYKYLYGSAPAPLPLTRCPQLRYQKCLDARPQASSSCLPAPPADSVARRVGSTVRKGVQSLLGSLKPKRLGAQTP